MEREERIEINRGLPTMVIQYHVTLYKMYIVYAL